MRRKLIGSWLSIVALAIALVTSANAAIEVGTNLHRPADDDVDGFTGNGMPISTSATNFSSVAVTLRHSLGQSAGTLAGRDSAFQIDVDGDGGFDFTIYQLWGSEGELEYVELSAAEKMTGDIRPSNSDFAGDSNRAAAAVLQTELDAGNDEDEPLISRIPGAVEVGPGLVSPTNSFANAAVLWDITVAPASEFAPGVRAYVALRFDAADDGAFNYGWLELEISDNQMVLHRIHYETENGASLQTEPLPSTNMHNVPLQPWALVLLLGALIGIARLAINKLDVAREFGKLR